MEPSEITISFQWDRAEFLDMRRKFGHQKSIRVLAAVGAVAFFITSILSTSNRVSYLFAGCALTYSIWSSWTMPIFMWKKSKTIKEPYRVLADDEGITLTTSVTTIEKPWSKLHYSTEYSDCFLLKKSRAEIFLNIPKRGFNSFSDEEIFRLWLKYHTTFKVKNELLL